MTRAHAAARGLGIAVAGVVVLSGTATSASASTSVPGPSPGSTGATSPSTSVPATPLPASAPPEHPRASSDRVASLSLSSPVRGAGLATLQSARTAPHDGAAITGDSLDALGQPVPFAAVTLTGGPGVYFSLSAGSASDPLTAARSDDLTRSLSTGTDASGAMQPVYAYFTRAGLNRITATSGTTSSVVRILVGNATDPYRVSVADLAGSPGSRLIVIGTVLDAFGNPVPNVRSGISLSTGDPAFGDLVTTTPATDSSGMFSTAFTANGSLRGSTSLSAAVAVNPIPDPAWLAAAGLGIRPGQAQGRATIRLSGKVGFEASASIIGRGKARLRGTATPGTRVDIFAKPLGALYSAKVGSTLANRSGNWGVGTTIARTTSFRAVTRHRRTGILTTVVHPWMQPRRPPSVR